MEVVDEDQVQDIPGPDLAVLEGDHWVVIQGPVQEVHADHQYADIPVLEDFNSKSTMWGFPAMDSRDFDGLSS